MFCLVAAQDPGQWKLYWKKGPATASVFSKCELSSHLPLIHLIIAWVLTFYHQFLPIHKLVLLILCAARQRAHDSDLCLLLLHNHYPPFSFHASHLDSVCWQTLMHRRCEEQKTCVWNWPDLHSLTWRFQSPVLLVSDKLQITEGPCLMAACSILTSINHDWIHLL